MYQREMSVVGPIKRELKREEDSIIAMLPHVGAAIQHATARAGFTHGGIGGLIGYTRSAVSKICAGKRDITLGRLSTLMSRTGSYAPLQKFCEMCGGRFVPDADAVRQQELAFLEEQQEATRRRIAELRAA